MSSIKPRTASLVIYQGDDLARLRDLRSAAEAASESKGPRRGGDETPGAAERDAYDAFVEEAAERAVVVDLQAIGRRRFAELVADHPVRQVDQETTDEDGKKHSGRVTHPDDAAFDVNTATFGLALAKYRDPEDPSVRTIVSPDFTSKALQDFLDDDLSDGDFRDLWVTAYYLNRAPSADPKATLYSTGSPRSTAT